MTINPAAASNDAYDLLDGSVSAFYAAVDEAIVASEVVKGQYRMTINPAYNSPNPVDSNSLINPIGSNGCRFRKFIYHNSCSLKFNT